MFRQRVGFVKFKAEVVDDLSGAKVQLSSDLSLKYIYILFTS